VWKSQLTPARRWLVDAMREAGFAQIKNLVIVNKEPVIKPAPKVRRRRKLSGPVYRPSPAPAGDYLLKEQIVNLFHQIDKIENGVITIDVRDGLPCELIE